VTEPLPDARGVLIAEQEKEIERLRITDEEREAVRWFSDYGDLQREARLAKVLKGLLERLG